MSLSDTSPNDWRYIAEGGATTVFSFCGLAHPEFTGKVLRLRKTNLNSVPGDHMEEFQNCVISRLLPSNVLPSLQSVPLDPRWLRNFALVHEGSRPLERRGGDSIDVEKRTAVLATDLIGTETLVVEIKPKWGFLPFPMHLSPESLPIKTRTCRFCIHKYQRWKCNVGGGPFNHFWCPLDLFSGDRDRIHTAILGLWDNWVDGRGSFNNLRIFCKGTQVLPGKEISLEQYLPHSSRSDSIQGRFADALTDAVKQTQVLGLIAELQRTLDPLDIEGLANLLQRVGGLDPKELNAITEEPSIAEWEAFIDRYLSWGKSANHSLPQESDLRYYVLSYLLSATFKDCSIFIRLLGHSEGQGQVMVIDLDMKSIDRLGKWEQLDAGIVQAYPRDGRKCVDSF